MSRVEWDVTVPGWCPACGGEGEIVVDDRYYTCPACNGRGVVEISYLVGDDMTVTVESIAPTEKAFLEGNLWRTPLWWLRGLLSQLPERDYGVAHHLLEALEQVFKRAEAEGVSFEPPREEEEKVEEDLPF